MKILLCKGMTYASPAGPSALLHSAQNGDNLDPKELGACSQGVFMMLDALSMVEVDLGKGRKSNECRAARALNELADIDWVDPSEDEVKKPSSTPLGTAGAISSKLSNGMSNALPQSSPSKPTALANPNPAISIAKTSP
ncbi:MAG: hypothetical protein NXY57DRAFT_1074413 [Lentinula lateritia]|uniref:Uncharacterized protein n=1 Tax=Lentinula lateritia TaxID=40482 RepID=A0ABQ8V5N6_9AGAR|nr:MAG: hypothetical protein NXY57DRAFT_1074413 [Lentinula lateritia]KAJ4475819.1 hypothetical protein C8R41DRAFT_964983 [Lentinula lateritia]